MFQAPYARVAFVATLCLTVFTAPAASQSGAALSASVANISSVSDVKTFLLNHLDLISKKCIVCPKNPPPSPPPPPPSTPTKVYVTSSTLQFSMCTPLDGDLLCGVGLIDVPSNTIALSPDGKTAYTSLSPVSFFTPGIVAKKQGVIAQNASAQAELMQRPEFQDKIHVCPIVSDYTIACGPPTGSNIQNPVSIAISPDGKTAYVSGFNNVINGFITVCAIQGLTLDCSQPTGMGNVYIPTGIALNPSGSILYVVNAGNSTITACEISGDVLKNCRVNNLGAPGTFGIALSPDGTTAYISTQNSTLGGITICNVSDYTVGPCTSELNPDNVFYYPRSISLSKDGSQLFATSEKGFFAAKAPSGRVVSCLVDSDTLNSCSNNTLIFAGRSVAGIAAH